ncbi:hypothetical protein Ancab_031728 [Ancistrocladus abbreviatus]
MNSFFTFCTRLQCNQFHSPMYSMKPIFNYSSNPLGVHDSNVRSWNKKISQLIRIGRLSEARSVFDKMPQRNTVTWNAMISGYVKRKEVTKARRLFDKIPESDRDVVSWNLMISGYVSCHGGGTRYVEEGRSLFDQMPKRDFVSWNTMISGYARVGRMNEALCLFKSMPQQNVVSWNAMITGFLQNGDVNSAVEWFSRMPKRDASSLGALISGLIQNGELDEAQRILLESGGGVDGKEDLVHAYNTLIAGYGQKGRIDEAERLFNQIPFDKFKRGSEKRKFERNVVSWNTMIMCYVKVGDILPARALFDQMVERDTVSWNTMISGYVQVSDMEQASHLFSHMPNPDMFSWNTIVSGYAQMGNLELALNFFERMPQKNLVSWNTMIAGYENHGRYVGAIKLFLQMQVEGEKPDRHSLSSVLGACAGLVALDLGRQIHQLVTKTVIADVPIKNSLVSMYSRCGAITEARTIFEEVKLQKDVISWNAMIGGYASNGYAAEALELFEAMNRLRVQPTYITFISVLNACAHTGLVEQGRKYFKSMVSDFGIEPRVEHFAALVDIVGRHGQLNEAMDLINSMPQKPDKAVWGALLGASRIHNNVEMARVAAEALMKLEPESSASYMLLYNSYADAEQWENAMEVKKMLERNNIKRERASSWITSAHCGE